MFKRCSLVHSTLARFCASDAHYGSSFHARLIRTAWLSETVITYIACWYLQFRDPSLPSPRWGTVTFWCGSWSPDPYLWLMNADQTPDPTPFFIDFKDAKEKYFFHFFFITFPQAHHLQSKKLNFLLKVCVRFLFCRHFFSPLNTLMRKGKDPDPYLWLLDPDPNPGGPKTCGSSSSGSGSPTLLFSNCFNRIIQFRFTLCRCQDPEGGFGGGPGQLAHLAPTYAAVNALAIGMYVNQPASSGSNDVFRFWVTSAQWSQIPDIGLARSRIRITEFKYFLPKKLILSWK